MPTVIELKSQTEVYTKEVLEEDIFINWINECMNDLSNISGYTKTASINYTAGQEEIELPADFISMIRVKQNDEKIGKGTTISDGYFTYGSHLELAPIPTADGVLDIDYYAELPTINDLSDIPALKEKYHRLLVYYAYMTYLEINERDNSLALNKYLGLKEQMRKEVQKEKLRNKPRTVRTLRSWGD